MSQKRIQLTLFIDENESQEIEKVRKENNPEQFELIKTHVTLCREDELQQIEKVILNLKKLKLSYFTIDLGDIIRFSEGKGVLISVFDKNEQFHELRKNILQGIIEKPRTLEPHITLIHPRNATCTNKIFEQLQMIKFPEKITFKKISLIEHEMGKKWRILCEFELK